MVYYDIRPETFTEQRGYFKIKSGDVIDIVIQDYPACNQVTCCSLWSTMLWCFVIILDIVDKTDWLGSSTSFKSSEQSRFVLYHEQTAPVHIVLFYVWTQMFFLVSCSIAFQYLFLLYLLIVKRLWACYMKKALYKGTTLLYFPFVLCTAKASEQKK